MEQLTTKHINYLEQTQDGNHDITHCMCGKQLKQLNDPFVPCNYFRLTKVLFHWFGYNLMIGAVVLAFKIMLIARLFKIQTQQAEWDQRSPKSLGF